MSAALPPPPDDEETRRARGCAWLVFGFWFALLWAVASAVYFAGHK